MENKIESPKRVVDSEAEEMARRIAQERSRTARWDLDIAVFLFAILIIVVILLFQGVGMQIVAPVAVFGLVMVWITGWRRGRQLYQQFYKEELYRLEHRFINTEETIEERVQQELKKRAR